MPEVGSIAVGASAWPVGGDALRRVYECPSHVAQLGAELNLQPSAHRGAAVHRNVYLRWASYRRNRSYVARGPNGRRSSRLRDLGGHCGLGDLNGRRHWLAILGNKARPPRLPLHEVARRRRCGPPALPCGVCRIGFRFRTGSRFGRSARRRLSSHGPNGFAARPPFPRRPGCVRLPRSTRPKAAGAPIRENGDKRVRRNDRR